MDLVEVIVAVIAGGLITQLIGVYRAKADVRNADRKQAVDESTGAATAADTIAKAATSVVALQDAQVGDLKTLIEEQRNDFQRRLDAQGAEISAYETRFDIQAQKFLRAEAARMALEEQVNRLRDDLARMGAQFEMVTQDNVALRRENGAMKTKMYEMAVGIQTLNRQMRGAGLEPAYVLEVPVSTTGRLGSIDAEAVRAMSE